MPDRHITFPRDAVLPSHWANAIQGVLSTLAEQFFLRRVAGSATQIEVPAGVSELVAAVAIDGRFRWRESTVQRTASGVAGTKSIWVTAADNSFSNVPVPNTDLTNYSFDLAITTGAATPVIVPGTVDIYRLVGTLEWDGSRITSLTPIVGEYAKQAELPVGSQVGYAGAADPVDTRWKIADGRLVAIATYPEFFSLAGHAYNLGVDPGSGMVKIPDKRGRAMVGADNMGTTGAAGRLPNSNRARGQNGGAERHALVTAELASHTHTIGVGTVGSGSALGAISSSFAAAENFGSASAGSGTAHNNLQPYEVDLVIVRLA